jgi:DNA ligase (NAD+)
MNRDDIAGKLFVDSGEYKDPEQFFGSNFVSHSEELEFLKSQGFATNPFNQNAGSVEQVYEVFEKLGAEREGLNYPIDGLVVKLDDNRLAGELGVVGKTPRGWCAMKYAAEESTTRLLRVVWQVGRTGKLTPVAELEPVELAGTTVKRATLHNYKEVVEKDLHALDTVVVHKAGDIIPEVVEILVNLRHLPTDLETEFFGLDGSVICPEICPSCGTQLEITSTGVDLFCPNTDGCREQILGRLSYYTQRNNANITGLSDKILERFVDEFGVHDVYDLYDLPWEKIQVMDGFGEKSVSKLREAVEKSREIEAYKFLSSLGIEGIGPEVAKLIVEQIDIK